MATVIVHLLTIYDDQLLNELSQAGFLLGRIPRTVVITEDVWEKIRQEITLEHSLEDALRVALHNCAINATS